MDGQLGTIVDVFDHDHDDMHLIMHAKSKCIMQLVH